MVTCVLEEKFAFSSDSSVNMLRTSDIALVYNHNIICTEDYNVSINAIHLS